MRKLLVYIEINGVQNYVGDICGDSYLDATFRYSREYLDNPASAPISISLPLREEEFDVIHTRNFFEGLLPEGFTRRTVAEFLKVGERDYISILANLGQECLGAVKVVEDLSGFHPASYEKLSLSQVQEIAREGVTQSVKLVTEAHLSLTGASGKVGLYFDSDSGAWFLPVGEAPSTHIVKQSHVRLNKLVVNERLSLLTASKLGIEIPESFIINTGKGNDEDVLFASRRYDRVFSKDQGKVDGLEVPLRLHQEDFAQALGIFAGDKYETTGKNYMLSMFNLLKNYAATPIEEQLKLWDMIVCNFLLGNTDAHIKNFSLLYGENLKTIKLAPAYDMISTIVYAESTKNMAFKIGGEFRLDKITRESFAKAAGECRISESIALKHFDDMYRNFEEALKEAADELCDQGFSDVMEIRDKILLHGGYAGIRG